MADITTYPQTFAHAREVARGYDALGWAVQEQANWLLDEIELGTSPDAALDRGFEEGRLNGNAVRMIRRWLEDARGRGYADAPVLPDLDCPECEMGECEYHV
jgi:hypothetical protein